MKGYEQYSISLPVNVYALIDDPNKNKSEMVRQAYELWKKDEAAGLNPAAIIDYSCFVYKGRKTLTLSLPIELEEKVGKGAISRYVAMWILYAHATSRL